jgi:protein-disulfide isomerase
MFIIGFFVVAGLLMQTKTAADNNGDTNTNTDPTDNNVSGEMTLQDITKDDWVRGDSKADISIIEFSDIDCPFCSRFHDTMNQVLAEYDDDIKWAYRHFPLPQLHPEAPKKAEAAECVGELGGNDKFWSFLDKLFANKTALADLGSVASSVGVDANAFQSCLDSGKYTDKIQEQSKEAANAGRVGCPRGVGTPFSVIVSGDTKIPICGALPYEQITAQLDSLLK